jgi:hypothetical protein
MPSEGWGVGVLCVLASDNTLDRGHTVAAGPEYDPSFGAIAAINVDGGRLPGFQRLEVELLRTFAIDRFTCQASLKLMNAYGLVDPFSLDLLRSDAGVAWRARLEDLSFVPLFPSFSLSVRF